MESLKPKFENFSKSVEALRKTIAVFESKRYEVPDDMYNVLVAGVIQHFEIAYETTWKYLKELLDVKHGIQVASPRTVFQSCYKYNVLPESITDQLVLLVDDRNKTTHLYDQTMAESMCYEILQHYKVLEQILELVKMSD